MQIVGSWSVPAVGEVHTVDVWYSRRRGAWMIERLDAEGSQIGFAHACATRDEAEACLGEWLRTYGETQLVGTAFSSRRRTLRRAA